MTGAEFKTVMDFENGLVAGNPVTINWTNCGSAYSAPATVSKVNAKSIVATLDNEVKSFGGYSYPKGQKIRVPRCVFGSIERWSPNNRVEPRGGYQPV